MKDKFERLSELHERITNMRNTMTSSTIENQSEIFNQHDILVNEYNSLISDVSKFKNIYNDLNISFIKKTVAFYFGMNTEVLDAKTRKREIVQARQIAMYFCKHETKNSLSVIGEKIGNKDHATVLHACKTVSNLVETDKIFRQFVKDIGNLLKQKSLT